MWNIKDVLACTVTASYTFQLIQEISYMREHITSGHFPSVCLFMCEQAHSRSGVSKVF